MAWIKFRDMEDVEIEYRDHGYEPDTNAHEIEWWFVDPAMKDIEPTEEEDAEVCAMIVEWSNEPEDPFW